MKYIGLTIYRGVLDSRLRGWRQQVRDKYNNKCAISGVNYDLEVHHIRSLYSIALESMKELQIDDIRPLEHDFKTHELYLNNIVSKHNLNDGILLNKTVHYYAHTFCGKNPDYDKWMEFIKKMNDFVYNGNISLENALKEYFDKK
jgi:hypothetical protein